MDFADLRSVTRFYVVQADGFEEKEESVTDEKEFNNLQEAVKVVQTSEAPVKYLKFNYSGSEYKLYPIPDSEEYRVVLNPIMN